MDASDFFNSNRTFSLQTQLEIEMVLSCLHFGGRDNGSRSIFRLQLSERFNQLLGIIA